MNNCLINVYNYANKPLPDLLLSIHISQRQLMLEVCGWNPASLSLVDFDISCCVGITKSDFCFLIGGSLGTVRA